MVIGTTVPGLFAAAVLVGMAITVVTLVRTPAVDIGLFRSIGHDALSLHLGHGLYHNPAGNGYTGTLYTPLAALLISRLDDLYVWNGWAVVLTVGATAVLGLSVAWSAWRAAGDRNLQTMTGALGLGGAAVWLVTSVGGVLYLGWTDELAWAFALVGLSRGRVHTIPNARPGWRWPP